MYHAIVKRIARKNFIRVNAKDFDAILKECVPDVHHRFGGYHALGGERHDRQAWANGSLGLAASANISRSAWTMCG